MFENGGKRQRWRMRAYGEQVGRLAGMKVTVAVQTNNHGIQVVNRWVEARLKRNASRYTPETRHTVVVVNERYMHNHIWRDE